MWSGSTTDLVLCLQDYSDKSYKSFFIYVVRLKHELIESDERWKNKAFYIFCTGRHELMLSRTIRYNFAITLTLAGRYQLVQFCNYNYEITFTLTIRYKQVQFCNYSYT